MLIYSNNIWTTADENHDPIVCSDSITEACFTNTLRANFETKFEDEYKIDENSTYELTFRRHFFLKW